MKAQRLKITEAGMTTFSDYYCGVKFTNGLSDEAVAPSVAAQIGCFIRIEGCDDDAQVGTATDLKNLSTVKAEVVTPLAETTPETIAPEEVVVVRTRWTRESLEKVADEKGISGLREIATSYGVRGRGIVELITEILAAQPTE